MSIAVYQSELDDYSRLYETGMIDAAEYKDLLESIAISDLIAEGAEELEKKEELNKAITAAITVASMAI